MIYIIVWQIDGTLSHCQHRTLQKHYWPLMRTCQAIIRRRCHADRQISLLLNIYYLNPKRDMQKGCFLVHSSCYPVEQWYLPSRLTFIITQQSGLHLMLSTVHTQSLATDNEPKFTAKHHCHASLLRYNSTPFWRIQYRRREEPRWQEGWLEGGFHSSTVQQK